MFIKTIAAIYFLLLMIVFLGCKNSDPNHLYAEWRIAGGTNELTHYSSLTQIDTNNVNQLQVAWVYHSEKKRQYPIWVNAMQSNHYW